MNAPRLKKTRPGAARRGADVLELSLSRYLRAGSSTTCLGVPGVSRV